MAICYRSALAQGGLKVDSLVVTTQPTKLTYIEGESVDLTGAVITATAGLLSGNVVSAVSVSPSVLTTPGTQTVTVSYGGEEATFTVTVEAVTLSITSAPTKTAYVVGETLDLTGIQVTATAGGVGTDVTSECTFSPADGSVITEAGTITITATFGAKTATTTVTAYALSGIAITTQPTKTAYIVGDSLDLTGIAVTATAGQITRDVTADCTFSPANGSTLSTAGSVTITAAFGGFTATTSVTAYAISGIAITTPPTKTNYKTQEQLDLTGIVVTATAGVLTKDVTADCTFSPADGTLLTTEGDFTITATYQTFTATTSYKVQDLVIKPFATATDAEIADMLAAHYAGDINLYNETGWEVGAERTVQLSAMAATGVGESHVAQTVTFVIMNHGGKTLNTAVSGKTTCAFIVGQKNMLASNGTREGGYMNSSDTNAGGWNSSARRTWCNSVYKNALPSTFAALFKQVHNYTGNGSSGQSTAVDSVDYFALPSEKEVFGSTTYADATAETNNTQFKYYETAENRKKYPGDGTGLSATTWWERSPYSSDSHYFCGVLSTGTARSYTASSTLGLAPFGCI